MKLSPEDLIRELSSVIDPTFARTAVESYIDMQQRFLAGDWGPAELNGGRLCEAVSRSLLQLDTGKISHTDSPGDVRKHLLDNNLPHNIIKSKDRYHIAKAIEVVYKFRSDRGPVHISPDYSANYMDSMFVLHAGKWIFAELLRLALKRDIKTVADTIAQLVQMQHSIIHELANRPLVLAKGITAPEEVLLLLYNAVNNRLSRAKLRDYATNQKPETVSVAISRLIKDKDIRPVGDNEVALTPNGQDRIINGIVPKYTPK